MIAAIIPARGGSKRLPGKNLARIGGSTLVELAIRCAQEVDEIDVIAVSTDDAEIAAEAFRCGALVIPRPAELATDSAGSEHVALHVANVLKLNDNDVLVLLQPTSPLRIPSDIRELLRFKDDAKTIKWQTSGKFSTAANGAVYKMSVASLREGLRFASAMSCSPMPADRSIDIDTAEDLARAQEWWCRRAVA